MFTYLKAWFSSKISKEDGQGLVEYALIIALIAILVIAAFPGLRTALVAVFNEITTKVGGTPSGT